MTESMKGTNMIRCIVADDQEALRAGLVGVLQAEDGIEVIGQATNGDATLALIERRRPDVAVMDLTMPGRDTLDVVRHLAERQPHVAVLVYTGDRSADTVRAAFEAGARGFALKCGPLSDVIRAVEAVADGKTYVDPTMATALMERQADGRYRLSPREKEVLQLLGNGLTTRTAAEELFLSPATVRSYIETAMQKLEVRSRTHAVAAALRGGLIA